MTAEDLKVENEVTSELPQYVKEYEKFYSFMQMMSNYIKSAQIVAEDINSKLDVLSSTGDILRKLAERLNIQIGEEFVGDENNLKTAIIGMSVRRASLSNIVNNTSLYNIYSSLEDTIISLFYPNITNVKIIDKAVSKNDYQIMSASIYITGTITDWETGIIRNFILPNITGLLWNIYYIPFGKDIFSFDKDEPLGFEPAESRGYGEVGWDEGEWVDVETS